MLELKSTWPSEEKYRRVWSGYWMFCQKIRYGKNFLGMLIPGVLLAFILAILAHPESVSVSLLGMGSALAFLTFIVVLYDLMKYRYLLKRVSKNYKEKEAGKEYTLKFDDNIFIINDHETRWNDYKFYYINGKDLYLFKTKKIVSVLWTGVGGDEKTHQLFLDIVKRNLKILPQARQIIWH